MRSSQVYKTYIRSVQRLLPCDNAQKKRYLAPLEESIHTYLTEHSGATVDDLNEEFGTPEMVAASYLENTEPVQIKRKISNKTVVVCLLLIAVILTGTFAIIKYHQYRLIKAAAEGYAVEVIEELPSEANPNPSPLEVH